MKFGLSAAADIFQIGVTTGIYLTFYVFQQTPFGKSSTFVKTIAAGSACKK